MKILVEVMQTFQPWAMGYDFSKAQYHGALKPITGVVCSQHGEFKQYAGQFQKVGGAGCPECGKLKRAFAKRATAAHLFETLRNVHGDKYAFPTLTENLDARPGTSEKLLCVCGVHGDFFAHYSNLLKGQGCPECGASRRGKYVGEYQTPPQVDVAKRRKVERQASLLVEFAEVHGGKYDYSRVEYDGMRTKVVITCPLHGDFEQTPMKHLAGQGCPRCSHRISKAEIEICTWLSAKGVVVEPQNRTLIAPAEVDIWLPERRVAIEFNGAHWHADDQLRKNTMLSKYEALKGVDARLISIFDFEWKRSRNAVENVLEAAIGRQRSVGGRCVSVRPITPSESRSFMDAWHVAGFVAGQLYLGMFYKDELIGAATFGKSRFEVDTVELLRYATSCHVIGGLPKVIKVASCTMKFARLTSYCDLRYGTGASYERAGFKLLGVTPPDYWWFKADRHFSRYQVQKHKLKRHPEFSTFYADDLTEREICERAGYRRITGIGHQKWEWVA